MSIRRIVFPEFNHPYIQEAIKLAKQDFQILKPSSLIA